MLRSIVEVPINVETTVQQIQGDESFICEMYELGVLPGSRISLERLAPLSGPVHIRSRSFSFYIRRDDAMNILCE